MYRKIFKRIFDVVGASFLIFLMGWLFVLVAIIVRVKLGSPVIFKQNRPGLNGKVFKLYKFRSMSDVRNDNGQLLPDSERLTKFGRILRSSSLDELPEIINILKGDMSFIGPRPWSVQYLKYFTSEEYRRHEVRPGLTGLAQVNGRTAANWDERLKYDITYVDNVTLKLDLKILFMTVKKVLLKSDVVDAEVQGDFDEYRRKQWESGEVSRNTCAEREQQLHDQ